MESITFCVKQCKEPSMSGSEKCNYSVELIFYRLAVYTNVYTCYIFFYTNFETLFMYTGRHGT